MVIGVTGPSGSGKSTFLDEADRLGYVVIDCDKEYHRVLETDADFQSQLEAAFGDLRDSEGNIDRKKLGAIVFNDSSSLHILDDLVFNGFTQKLADKIQGYSEQGSTVVIEAINLVESSLRDLCDVVVAVVAPKERCLQRIMDRDNLSKEYALSRLNSQGPWEYYASRCDIPIMNTFQDKMDFEIVSRKYLKSIVSGGYQRNG